MTQGFVFYNPAKSASLLSEVIRDNLDSLGTLNAGDTAPSNPQVGMPWLDTSGSPTAFELSIYTAAGWITIAEYPITSGYASAYRSAVSVAASTWTITHSLSVRPVAVHCFDSSYNSIEPLSVDTSNVNVTTITHAAALTGHVVIVG